jgi:hypothetical protein
MVITGANTRVLAGNRIQALLIQNSTGNRYRAISGSLLDARRALTAALWYVSGSLLHAPASSPLAFQVSSSSDPDEQTSVSTQVTICDMTRNTQAFQTCTCLTSTQVFCTRNVPVKWGMYETCVSGTQTQISTWLFNSRQFQCVKLLKAVFSHFVNPVGIVI